MPVRDYDALSSLDLSLPQVQVSLDNNSGSLVTSVVVGSNDSPSVPFDGGPLDASVVGGSSDSLVSIPVVPSVAGSSLNSVVPSSGSGTSGSFPLVAPQVEVGWLTRPVPQRFIIFPESFPWVLSITVVGFDSSETFKAHLSSFACSGLAVAALVRFGLENETLSFRWSHFVSSSGSVQ